MWTKRLIAIMGISQLYCCSCGGNLQSKGYNHTVCLSCKQTVYYEYGNLASVGKGHLYKNE